MDGSFRNIVDANIGNEIILMQFSTSEIFLFGFPFWGPLKVVFQFWHQNESGSKYFKKSPGLFALVLALADLRVDCGDVL